MNSWNKYLSSQGGRFLRIYNNTTGLKYTAISPYEHADIEINSRSLSHQVTAVKNVSNNQMSLSKNHRKLLEQTRARYEALYADIDKVMGELAEKLNNAYSCPPVRRRAED